MSTEQLLNTARQALDAGDLDTAQRIYASVLERDPNSGEALYRLSIIQFKKDAFPEGIELAKKAISADPENPLPRLALARALGDIDKEAEAIQVYAELLALLESGSAQAETVLLEQNMLEFKLATRNKNRDLLKQYGQQVLENPVVTPKSLGIIALVYSRASMFEESKLAYEKLLEMQAGDAKAAFGLAEVYEKLRQPENAITYYEMAAQNSDDPALKKTASVRLELLTAFGFLAEDDEESAHNEFMAILALDENNIIANMNVGGYLYRNKQYEQARQIFQKVVKLQPANLDAHYRLAVVYLDMRDALNGVRELDYILAAAPDTAIAESARGTLAKVETKWDLQAIRKTLGKETDLLARLENNPDDAALMVDLGALMMSQRRPDEAIKYFEAAIAADPNYGDAYYKLGLYHEERRQFELAVDVYQSAMQLIEDPDVANEIENRFLMVSADLYMQNKEYARAEEMLLEAAQKRPDEAKIYWALAILNAQQGDLESAAQWYLKVVDLRPDHIQGRMNLARTYERLEEEDKAIEHYRAVSFAENATPEIKQAASDRVDYLQRQINGVSYVVGYGVGVNDNLNSARAQKFFEYRSNLYAGLYYKYKINKDMKFSLNFTPAYSIYHRSQYDFFNFSFMPGLGFDKWGYDWNVGFNRARQSSVLRQEKSTTVADTLNGSASWRNEDKVGYRVAVTYRDFESSQNAFFDADLFSVGVDVSQPGPENTYLGYGYSLSVNHNKNSLGSDYAYVGQSLNGRIDKRMNGRLSAYLNSNMTLNLYQNGDSATNFQRKRRTFGFGAGLGLNYRFDARVSMYAGYFYYTQHSNLPVGFIFNELQAVEGQQSASLGSFNNNTINAGVRMSF